MNTITKSVGAILILTFLFFQTAVQAQNAKKQLEGFYYKEVLVNAETTTQNLPVIIALHWMRSNPEEFAQYVDSFKNPVRILLVEGNYPYKEGFSFYPTSPDNYYKMPDDDKMKVLLNESDKLAKFIKAATILYPSDKKPIIIGASQGGDLSYMIGIRYNNLISLSCPLLATIDNRIITKIKSKTVAPIIAFHGEDDPIVNVSTAENHIKLLKKNGYTAKINTYKGVKHDISEKMESDYIRLISTFLK
nr:dienelactone hydrolase family protein [uncultured Flavobacterium sp.]